MDAARIQDWISPADYLAFEAEAGRRGEKYEYVDGHVYAMAGASRRHARVALKLAMALEPLAAARGCEVYTNAVKVLLEAANCYYYPDVVVACDPADTDASVIERPSLVAEILSPTTESTDRREKLVAYKHVPSIRDILMIDPEADRIEHHRRLDAAGTRWLLATVEGGGTLQLATLEGAIAAEAVVGR